jgi:putative cell wall-binding protein
MKKIKKSLALLTVLSMVLTLFVGVAAASERVEVYVDDEFEGGYTSIEEALSDLGDVSEEEVVIEVYAGEYEGFTVDVESEEMTIVAVDGASKTTIEGSVEINVANVTFEDFTVEGESEAESTGIAVNADEVTVIDNVVTEFEVGIAVAADKVVVENNELFENIAYGIYADLEENNVFRVRNNEIENAEEDEDEGTEPLAGVYIQVPDGYVEFEDDEPTNEITAYIYDNHFTQVERGERSIATNGSDDDEDDNYLNLILRRNTFNSYFEEEIGERLAGDNRYETAVEISKEGWVQADAVVLARGDDFADALAGTTLAADLQAPILLTQTNSLPDVVAEEIERLWASEVYILGGENAVSEDVVEELKDLGIKADEITRIAGDDRFETAVEIAEELSYDFEQAVLVNGMDFPDALAAGPLAAALEAPILLTLEDELPEATADALEDDFDVEEITIVGGSAVISSDLYEDLLDDDYEVERLDGDDRFETAVEVAELLIDDYNADQIYVANGLGFADALAGGALAAQENGVIVLTLEDRNPDCVTEFVEDNEFEDEEVFFLGGETVLSEEVVSAFTVTKFSSVAYGE